LIGSTESPNKLPRNKSPKAAEQKKTDDLTDYYLLAAATEMEQRLLEMEQTNSLAQKQLDEYKSKQKTDKAHLVPKPIQPIA
jgi:hypothetical protein